MVPVSSLCLGVDDFANRRKLIKATKKLAGETPLCAILRLHLTRMLSPILFMVKLILD